MPRSVLVAAFVLGVLVPASSSEPGEMHTGMSSAAASYDSLCSKGDDGPSAVVMLARLYFLFLLCPASAISFVTLMQI
jgi:Flp pilus assembly protein TadD